MNFDTPNGADSIQNTTVVQPHFLFFYYLLKYSLHSLITFPIDDVWHVAGISFNRLVPINTIQSWPHSKWKSYREGRKDRICAGSTGFLMVTIPLWISGWGLGYCQRAALAERTWGCQWQTIWCYRMNLKPRAGASILLKWAFTQYNSCRSKESICFVLILVLLEHL